ncbi:MAG: hypothetical protein ABIF40_02380 [archaeon]
MARKISVKLYLIAAILTIFIFLMGTFLGLVLEKERLQATENINAEQRIQLTSLQLQRLYLDVSDPNCDALNEILRSNTNQLNDATLKLIEYSKRSIIDLNNFDLTLREFFLTEIQYILLSKEIQKVCPSDTVEVLYFYRSDEDETQGFILDYLKILFGDRLMVFSFNADFDQEPMINVLLTSYGVSDFPVVIVEDQVFEGYTSKDELIETICLEFNELPEECNLI